MLKGGSKGVHYLTEGASGTGGGSIGIPCIAFVA